MDSRSAESAYYSPKGPFLSEALDSTDSIRFSNFQRFELVMNFGGKGFCGFSRTGESVRFPIRHLEVRILPPQPVRRQAEQNLSSRSPSATWIHGVRDGTPNRSGGKVLSFALMSSIAIPVKHGS